MNCFQCNTDTTNPKFCSRSCATRYNNSIKPKRLKKTRMCKRCPTEVEGRNTLCDLCNPQKVDWSDITIKSLREKRSYQINSRLRSLARSWYIQSNRPMFCVICKYSVHVDICHIVDLQYFSINTTVAEVNSASNMIALCKNHHWEFDNNLL